MLDTKALFLPEWDLFYQSANFWRRCFAAQSIDMLNWRRTSEPRTQKMTSLAIAQA
jgi:hypothetical protein